jgi:ATP-binding cassette subfamily F protein 3
MLTLQNLSFEFSGRWLYKNIDWQIKSGEKIGLIGRNGAGKSTLLRLISGQYQPTEGKISKPQNYKIGFLNQDLLSFASDSPIFEIALGAFAQEKQLMAQIEAILMQLEKEQTPELLQSLDVLESELQARDGYLIETKTREVLGGLGFSVEDQKQPFNTFSGGWRMRVMLAQILLSAPDLLLLDEPTNHLDLPSIEWLEDYIQNFPGSYIIVSHDRSILDKMTSSIVEIAHQKLHFYRGNFSRYLVEKEERLALHKAAYINQQKEIKETEDWINRFRAKATKASQVQSRIKQLEKLERIPPPEDSEKPPQIRFQASLPSGVDVLTLKNVSKKFGAKRVLDNCTITLHRGDKVGLIGANGIGKSTILRILANKEEYEGERIEGRQVILNFYAQHQLEALNLNFSIWEEITNYAGELGDTYLRTILGCLLFSGDDIHKKISILSGGEKARVALAKTLISKANLLLLDEPTNHLDMVSVEVLINALNEYQGTYVIVSHDRYFLSKTTNKIWYIEEKILKEYPGGYEEFELWKSSKNVGASVKAPNGVKLHTQNRLNKSELPLATTSSLSLEARKKNKQIQNQLKNVENLIAQLEAEKAEILKTMTAPENATNFDKLKVLQEKNDTIEQKIIEALEKWETLENSLNKLAL